MPDPCILWLPGYLAPGLNGKGGLMRAHWAIRERWGDACRERIAEVWAGARFEVPVSIDYTRCYCGTPMDWDNACASFKLIGDALVDLGVIQDDSPKWVPEFRPHQVRVAKKVAVGTRLVIAPVGEHVASATLDAHAGTYSGGGQRPRGASASGF